jgi:hypothetical protein
LDKPKAQDLLHAVEHLEELRDVRDLLLRMRY